MNKKVILAIVVVVVIAAAVILGITLGRKDSVSPVANTKTKSLEIVDDNLGYKTTFTYPETDDYKVTNVDNDGGRSVTVDFESEAKNMSVETYYSMQNEYVFEIEKESRKESKNFKEYNFNGYDAYVYSDYDDSAYLIIMLDKELEESLFLSIEKINDNTEDSIMDAIDSEAFQLFLNSITFEVTK